MGSACTRLFFELGDDYNRVSKHNCNFKCTQAIRLIIMLLSIAVWGTLLYIWAKSILAQLVIFALTAWIIAISTLSFSAGREVCEAKMVHRI